MDVGSNATCLTSLRERESHLLFLSFSISAKLPTGYGGVRLRKKSHFR